MNTKKGFTLIELSIVLLILFLITGGIIGGSKLIEQAQMKKFITEYKKIKKDIREFILVYGSLPGDFHRATEYWGADTVNGDNNGYWNTRQQEGCLVWRHLQKAELIPLTPNNIYYLNECSNHYLIDQHVPRIKAYKNVGVHTITIPNKRHKSGLAFGKEVLDERNIRGFLTGKILSSMDQKIDDGKPGTGLMKADYAFDNNNQYSYAECVNQFPNPTEYVVRSDQAVCSPYFLLYDILH